MPQNLFAFAALFADFRHMLAILRDFGTSTSADICHMLAILGHFRASPLADRGHVIAILRNRAAPLATCSRVSFRIAVPAPSRPMLASRLCAGV